MKRDHPHIAATYKLLTLDDATVEVSVPETQPTKVSGFDTQEKAEAWIERHKANVATGSLKGAQAIPFNRRSPLQ